jgi:hypothetical protein
MSAGASAESGLEPYEAWNKAIADRYFHDDNRDKPVYLAIDDDEITELLAQVGGSGPADESLAAAVRGTLSRGDSRFVGHLVARTEWRRSGMNGPPPYVAVLALCVLAASRMARDPEAGIAPHAYYPQLNPLLNLPRFGGMPPGFDQLESLWTDLCHWLDRDLSGRLGTSTASTHSFFKNIGWPISQCLLREADRRRLPDFFRAVALEPHVEIDVGQLWMLFLNWAREGCGLSEQGLRVVRKATGEVAEQMAEIIKREFDVWDGELRDAQGRRRGNIALVLEISRGGRRTVAKLVPRKPEGFPERARWQLVGGQDVEIAAAGEEWYQPLQIEPNRAILTSGISMSSNGFALAYEPGPVVPLRASLGVEGWASVRQATALEEHCVVTTEALLPRVQEFLTRYAESGWRVSDHKGTLPGGWRVIERVKITRAVPEVDEDLRRLAPRLHTATRLEGGLQIAPRQYLTGGEPDLWITVERGERTEIQLDERRFAASEDVLEVKLATLDPPIEQGDHEIVAGGIRRRFSTLSGFPVAIPAGAGSLGQVLERHGAYRPSSVDAERLPSDGPRRGQVFVCGASATAHLGDLPEAVHPPVLVPVGFANYTLLGAHPGDVLTLVPPEEPSWLRGIGLEAQCQFFDQPVPFQAEWLVLEGRLGTQIRALRLPPREPDATQPSPTGSRGEGLTAAWSEAIRDAGTAGARPRTFGEIWDEYVGVAS